MVVLFSFTSCTDVVDVNVPTGKERLVIEASIDWVKGTQGNLQQIKLSNSTPYFAKNTENPVTNAEVKVVNTNDGAEFVFQHSVNGLYTTSNFIPVLNDSYSLEISYNGNMYAAEETLLSVTEITKIEQTSENGFNLDDSEVRIYFNDPSGVENYYLAQFKSNQTSIPYLETLKDEFVDGNQNFIEYEDSNIGTQLNIRLYGISETYYNYMTLLIQQNQSDGVFQTIPSALIGNCKNVNDPKEEVLGYFRLSEVDKTNHTIQ